MVFTKTLDLRPRVWHIQSETSHRAGPSVATFQNAPQTFAARRGSVDQLVGPQGSGQLWTSEQY